VSGSQNDLSRVQNRLQAREVLRRRDDVSPCGLHRLYIEGDKLRLVGLGIPEGVVLGLEETLDLVDAIVVTCVQRLPVGATVTVGKGHEVRSIGEVSEATAIA